MFYLFYFISGHSQDRTLTLSKSEFAAHLHKDEAITKLFVFCHCGKTIVNFVTDRSSLGDQKLHFSVTWLPPLSAKPKDHFPVRFFLYASRKIYTLCQRLMTKVCG